ncbi:hypothetical protein BLNAU_13567 [Blattamonas nauphoetae]|uniref:Uncharacterized protein n=1 Tax=Blattamonas nauphoetae TaxID=2049346 RepID=A0ABQ9XJB5_9EUKA|nr:hypothetical protein BLNAU_13567 [Blattamonas nauphoetae]
MCMSSTPPSRKSRVWDAGLEAVAQVSLNVSFTNCEGSSAPKGSGGLIYVSGDSQLDFCDVSSEETSTGECGGFVYAGGDGRSCSLTTTHQQILSRNRTS